MNAVVARDIEAFAAERQVTYLMHFTRLTNLASILAQGLIPRDRLANEDGCNDAMRLDGTHAVCASIGFPNYRMFYRLRKENPGEQWVVLVISVDVLWTTQAVFCRSNAASNGVTAIPLEERMTVAAFRAMYEDFEEIQRADLGIADRLPTNPQAEVLLLDGVPRSAILGVLVNTEDLKLRLQAAYPGLEVQVFADVFSARSDYLRWRRVVA